VRTVSHVAYRVASLEQATAGYRVVAEPFDVFGEVRVSFVEVTAPRSSLSRLSEPAAELVAVDSVNPDLVPGRATRGSDLNL
jgi:hypothetical protein